MYRYVSAAALAVVTLSAVPALAADLPAYEPAPAVAAPVPSFTWTGPYLGVQAGYIWGDSNVGRIKPEGFTIGGYLGYNYQMDGSPVVVGIETDFNWSDADDKAGRVKFDQRWNGATRARVGYAFDRFLVYGAGGVAYADTRVRVGGAKDSKTNFGWTVGAGAEYAVTDNVSTRAEYRYTDYGSDKYNFGKASQDEHRVMVGVAYKFGW
ncbi:outer membrane protein [Chenggangzhangella methanolivorans]|uniref:Porin family protein n=1 Tax=Chenggangzhangella methanolivorans TaxID=1437009 RepID=A0A9E6REY3_9HYPH|nr:outer membrane protein [Chenggangzhangella methanolivorans]QZN99691.1 porin family protein [Chenggangzhangella methanolivorans]